MFRSDDLSLSSSLMIDVAVESTTNSMSRSRCRPRKRLARLAGLCFAAAMLSLATPWTSLVEAQVSGQNVSPAQVNQGGSFTIFAGCFRPGVVSMYWVDPKTGKKLSSVPFFTGWAGTIPGTSKLGVSVTVPVSSIPAGAYTAWRKNSNGIPVASAFWCAQATNQKPCNYGSVVVFKR